MLISEWLGQCCIIENVLLSRHGYDVKNSCFSLASSEFVSATRCDVATAEEVAALLTVGEAKLAATIHASGVLHDRGVLQQTVASVRSVFAPKIGFLAVSGMMTHLEALRMIGMFSSISAFLGSPGQSNYAAANIVLNAWAETLQLHGISGALTSGSSCPFCFIFVHPARSCLNLGFASCRKQYTMGCMGKCRNGTRQFCCPESYCKVRPWVGATCSRAGSIAPCNSCLRGDSTCSGQRSGDLHDAFVYCLSPFRFLLFEHLV